MTTIKVRSLTLEGFQKYGRYVSILAPVTPSIGEQPILFYRDIIQLGGVAPLSFSNTVVCPRKLCVDILEYHTATGEGFMMLDGDAIICVGIATADGEIPVDELESFYVPKGVMVYVNAGVWHYAPYCVEDKPINSLVILPERTYANDCIKKEVPEQQKLMIEL